jgi:hypothetical protein
MTRSPDRACHRKQLHATREAAISALYALARNRDQDPRQMQVYKCPYAPAGIPHWHYGHRIAQPKGRKP